MTGPAETPFQGGKFQIDLDLSDGFPFKMPKVTVKTPIFHPQVDPSNGDICQAAIEKEWAPTRGVRFVLESVLSIIMQPSADNPLNQEAAQMYAANKTQWQAKAAEQTAANAK